MKMRFVATSVFNVVVCCYFASACVGHVFRDDPPFWRRFESAARAGRFDCGFPSNIMSSTAGVDVRFYGNPAAAAAAFRARREGAEEWAANHTLWADIALGAARERADGSVGPHSRRLLDLRMLDAFTDYVDHLDHFQRVASIMREKGEEVRPPGTGIHDFDKLDPVMLVGYSERFEDGVETELWHRCLQHHTLCNPHHQAHCVWHDCCGDRQTCDESRESSLREMVCDKVARRLQKEMGGVVTPLMWDVKREWFGGMPEEWIDKAMDLMKRMK